MSLIYDSGVRATAIANITAAINARITTRADGSKALDVASVVAWARAQFHQMYLDGEAVSPMWSDNINPTPAVEQCAAVIDPTHWQSRPDWPIPNSSQVSAPAASAAAVAAQQATLKNLSDQITAFYSTTAREMYEVVDTYMRANIYGSIHSGVIRLEENRAYLVTYVTDRGEESKPGPISAIVEVDQNDTVDITVPAPPAGRHITHFNLYRSNSTNTQVAAQLVPNDADENGWPIDTLTVTDTKKSAELLEPCPTLLWDEPPEDLRGLVGGANGGMAGFRGNELCPCVPYVPYAFPVSMRITTEWPIVGLGASGQNYFVGTRGRPYIVTGADTQSLIATKLEDEQACVAKRSIVGMGGGFLYASPDGLCLATLAGVRVLTEEWGLFDRESWQALKPESIVAAESEGCYVFRWDNGSESGMYALHLASRRLIELDNVGSALYRDAVTDRLYLAEGLAIKAVGAAATKRTAVWKTKLIELPDHQSFAWVQAQSNYENDGTVTVKVYRDGALVHTATLDSREPQRLPPGISNEWEVQIESDCRITSLTLAANTEELKAL
ncbi:MAG TPA: hypothetical protein VNV16_09640 [Methylibium sp.]|nr:hypothetical protein [Methylibium sp.]